MSDNRDKISERLDALEKFQASFGMDGNGSLTIKAGAIQEPFAPGPKPKEYHRVCADCGNPEFPHRYRHMFKPTDEEWRSVLTPLFSSGHLTFRTSREEALAKQVVAERRRAEVLHAEIIEERECSAKWDSFYRRACGERDALHAEVERLKNSPAICLDGAKARIALLEKLLRELLGAATITEGSPSIIGRKMIDRIEKTAFGDD